MPQPVAIDPRQSLLLSERDRAAFFDALVHPPKPNTRLLRAFHAAQERVRLIDATHPAHADDNCGH
jgi:hypothetical protein